MADTIKVVPKIDKWISVPWDGNAIELKKGVPIEISTLAYEAYRNMFDPVKEGKTQSIKTSGKQTQTGNK